MTVPTSQPTIMMTRSRWTIQRGTIAGASLAAPIRRRCWAHRIQP